MPEVKLGDIAEEIKKNFDGDKSNVRSVGLGHLIPETVTLSDWDENKENLFKKFFRKGDVLFGRRRAYLKKAVVAPFEGICSGDIIVIRALPNKILPELLPFAIQNDNLFNFAVGKSAGSMSPRVNWSDLKEYKFFLPPLDEQKKFAKILWAMEETKQAYQNLLTVTDELIKARFIEMFGEYLDEQKNFSPLENLCTSFVDGDWIESKDQSEVGIRLIQTGNVGEGTYIDKAVKARFIDEKTFERLNCTEVKENDILISRLPDPIGRACIVPLVSPKMITAVDCTIARLKNIIVPNFFISCTLMMFYKVQIEKYTTGSTRKRISRNNLGKIKIPVPPLELQEEFAKFVESCEQSKKSLRQTLENLKLMQKRFLVDIFGTN